MNFPSSSRVKLNIEAVLEKSQEELKSSLKPSRYSPAQN